VNPVSGLGRPGVLITKCGRQIHTGQFVVNAVVPIQRVTVTVGPDQDGTGAAWVSLTAAEAVRLANALLAQADTILTRGDGGH
jgi:hypothetical protein